jgi:hypothetical protein
MRLVQTKTLNPFKKRTPNGSHNEPAVEHGYEIACNDGQLRASLGAAEVEAEG